MKRLLTSVLSDAGVTNVDADITYVFIGLGFLTALIMATGLLLKSGAAGETIRGLYQKDMTDYNRDIPFEIWQSAFISAMKQGSVSTKRVLESRSNTQRGILIYGTNHFDLDQHSSDQAPRKQWPLWFRRLTNSTFSRVGFVGSNPRAVQTLISNIAEGLKEKGCVAFPLNNRLCVVVKKLDGTVEVYHPTNYLERSLARSKGHRGI